MYNRKATETVIQMDPADYVILADAEPIYDYPGVEILPDDGWFVEEPVMVMELEK